MKTRATAIAELLFVDFIGSIIWFPVWWYTRGLANAVAGAGRALRYRAQAYAFSIWIRNFFVPMYGQYDWEGRIISVVMRFVVLVGRGFAFAVEAVIYGLGIVAWCIIPPLAVVLALENGILSLIHKSIPAGTL